MKSPAQAALLVALSASLAPRTAAQCDLETLAGSSTGAGHDFGRALAADLTSAAIGAPLEGLSGAVYVFERGSTGWSEAARLIPSDAASLSAPAQFGVALALAGDTLLVGADHAGASDAGAVYVFERVAGTWAETAKLLPSASVNVLWFGASVALDGERAAIGASGSANQSGAVYVFERQSGVWSQTAELLASDAGASDDHFGRCVALAGEVLVAGAPFDSDQYSKQGAAYVFERQGGAWIEVQEIHAPDSAWQEQLGYALAFDGSTLAIGGPKGIGVQVGTLQPQTGRVLVFERQGGTWVYTDLLLAPDGISHENFGSALALAGSLLAVGVPFDDALGEYSGSVYLYHRLGSRFSLADKLLAEEGLPYEELGTSVAFAGDELLTGAAKQNLVGLDSGAVHAFSVAGPHCPGRPCALQKLVSPEGSSFGSPVELAGDHALVRGLHVYVFRSLGTFWEWTATLPELGANSLALGPDGGALRALLGQPYAQVSGVGTAGSAKVYTGSGAAWSLEALLLSADLAAGDEFGYSVDFDGDRAIVGAPRASGGFFVSDAGAAYVFRRTAGVWSQEAKLSLPSPANYDVFGRCVAIRGEVALIGAPWRDAPTNGGAAYAYRFDGSAWILEATLDPAELLDDDNFGAALAFDGEYAAVGAPRRDEAGYTSGAVYVFQRSAGSWTQVAKLLPDTAAAVDFSGSFLAPVSAEFGKALALDGERLLVGAPAENAYPYVNGVAWVFRRDAFGQWLQESRFTGYDGLWNERSGVSVALDGDRLVIGSTTDDDAEESAGSAVVYSLSGTGCPTLVAHSIGIPTNVGGSQDFYLGAPANAAGDLYWILGSLSGTSPATELLGATLSLAQDFYFDLMLFSPGAGPVKASVGFLDSSGVGHAQLEIPGTLYASLAGLTAHHAFAAVDLGTLAVSHVSNPVEARLK